MTDSSPEPIDRAFVLTIVRSLLAAALIGWLSAELAEWVIHDRIFPRYGKTDWYPDFLSFAKMMVGTIVAGLVCAGFVHLRVLRARARGKDAS